MSDVQPKPRWQDQRYLSEHWGPTMAAQTGHAIDDYRAAVREALRDLLASETFGPTRVFAALDNVAAMQKAAAGDVARRGREARNARLRAAGGCPVCADSDTPNPDAHRAFHDRMTAAPAVSP